MRDVSCRLPCPPLPRPHLPWHLSRRCHAPLDLLASRPVVDEPIPDLRLRAALDGLRPRPAVRPNPTPEAAKHGPVPLVAPEESHFQPLTRPGILRLLRTLRTLRRYQSKGS